MGRRPGEPTKVIRLPVDVVDALRAKAAKKGVSIGDLLRPALGLEVRDGSSEE